MVGLDELPSFGDRGGRQALVVLEDDFELPAGDLPAALLPEKLAAAVHVLAGLGDGAGQRSEEADLDRALGERLPRQAERARDGERDDRDQQPHCILLSAGWGQVLHSDIQVDTTSRSARECRNARPDPGLRWRRAPWYARRRPYETQHRAHIDHPHREPAAPR